MSSRLSKSPRRKVLWRALFVVVLLAVLLLGVAVNVSDYRDDVAAEAESVCRVESATMTQERRLLRLELVLSREGEAVRLTEQSAAKLVFDDPVEASTVLHDYAPGREHPCWIRERGVLLAELRSPAERHFPLLLTLLVSILMVTALALRWPLSVLASRYRSQKALAHRLVERRSPVWALVVLSSCAGLTVLICYGMWWTGARALLHGLGQSRWEPAEATIMFSDAELGGEDNDEYELILLYSYEYDGEQYYGNSYRYLGSIPSSAEVVAPLEESLQEQSTHRVWVDPDEPRRAVLERSQPTVGLLALPLLSLLLLLYNPTQLSLISVYRWAFRQFRRQRMRTLPRDEAPEAAELSPREVSQRILDAAQLIDDRLALSAGGAVEVLPGLRLSLGEWSLRVEGPDQEELQFDYARSSLHLSRSREPSPGESALPRRQRQEQSADWLHVELRSGRARLTLSAQAVEAQGIALLEGVPWLERGGQRCDWELLVKLVGLLLEREMELAPWTVQRGPAKPAKRALALRFDSAARARNWFLVYGAMMPASVGLLLLTLVSALQPYANESRWPELVLSPILGVAVLVNGFFVLRSWKLWRGRATRIRVCAEAQPQLGQPLTLSAELGGTPSGPVSVTLRLWSEERRTIWYGDDSKVERKEHWHKEVALSLSSTQREASGVLYLPLEEDGGFTPLSAGDQGLSWRLSAATNVLEKGFELGEAIELEVLASKAGPTALANTAAPVKGELRVGDERCGLRIVNGRELWPRGALVRGETWWGGLGPEGVRFVGLYLLREAGGVCERVYELLRLKADERQVQHAFAFVLPDEALSFSGDLVSSRWFLELVVMPADEVLRHELRVAPV